MVNAQARKALFQSIINDLEMLVNLEGVEKYDLNFKFSQTTATVFRSWQKMIATDYL
jgi:hypothetical protein